MPSRATADLTPRFRTGFAFFAMYLVEAGVPFLLVQTLRSVEESAANVAKGVSWVGSPDASKHVDAIIRGWEEAGADAADVVPYDTYLLHGPDKVQWDTNDPVWLKVRDAAHKAGLGWGVTKMVKGKLVQVDPGHVYFPGPIYGPNYRKPQPTVNA